MSANPPNNVKDAMSALKKFMQKNPDYAHGWHCNISMAFYRILPSGADLNTRHSSANKAASLFMRLVFDIETSNENQLLGDPDLDGFKHPLEAGLQ
jgi:hypothetical protein